MSKKKGLSPQEQAEARVLHKNGHAIREIAKYFRTTKYQVEKALSGGVNPKNKLPIAPQEEVSSITKTSTVTIISGEIPEPIDFLHQKLISLQQNIDQAGEISSMGALAGLHKLHKETYNEYQAELKKHQGTKTIEDPEQLVEIFMRNYTMLPPYLKDIIKTRIEEES